MKAPNFALLPSLLLSTWSGLFLLFLLASGEVIFWQKGGGSERQESDIMERNKPQKRILRVTLVSLPPLLGLPPGTPSRKNNYNNNNNNNNF
jgi:hypothetical protein